MEEYLLDTYALIEIVKENNNYEKFKDTINFTSLLNLLELHNAILKSFGEGKADEITEKFKELLISFDIEDIKLASKLKSKFKPKKFSYIDCLGYAISINRKWKFVTGDKEFENLDNVEFVK
ncbi:MAG: PIN domain-containing protein [Candidatus Woesearchaeota archaeon]